MIKAVGYRLLVKPDELETTSEGGIVLVMDEEVASSGIQTGTVISIGDACWEDHKAKQWCKEGDKVFFAKFAGKYVVDPDSGDKLFVMNDTDIIGLIE